MASKVLYTVEEGSFFGVIDFMTQRRRLATLRAPLDQESSCILFYLTAEDFENSINKYPDQMHVLNEIAQSRISKKCDYLPREYNAARQSYMLSAAASKNLSTTIGGQEGGETTSASSAASNGGERKEQQPFSLFNSSSIALSPTYTASKGNPFTTSITITTEDPSKKNVSFELQQKDSRNEEKKKEEEEERDNETEKEDKEKEGEREKEKDKVPEEDVERPKPAPVRRMVRIHTSFLPSLIDNL